MEIPMGNQMEINGNNSELGYSELEDQSACLSSLNLFFLLSIFKKGHECSDKKRRRKNYIASSYS
jgi:hypothetical protein